MYTPQISSLTKEETDSLLILHFKINRTVPKDHVDKLIYNNWIERVPSGFRSTGKARAIIRKLC